MKQGPSTLIIDNNGIKGTLYVERNFNGNEPASLQLIATNSNAISVDNFNFQAAVTKVFFKFSIVVINLKKNG